MVLATAIMALCMTACVDQRGIDTHTCSTAVCPDVALAVAGVLASTPTASRTSPGAPLAAGRNDDVLTYLVDDALRSLLVHDRVDLVFLAEQFRMYDAQIRAMGKEL